MSETIQNDELLDSLTMFVVYKKQTDPKPKDYKMEFKITLMRNGRAMTCDYSMGIWYLLRFNNPSLPNNWHGNKIIKSALATGILELTVKYKLKDLPQKNDVLWDLLMSSTAHKLRKLYTASEIEQLQEYYQDY